MLLCPLISRSCIQKMGSVIFNMLMIACPPTVNPILGYELIALFSGIINLCYYLKKMTLNAWCSIYTNSLPVISLNN